jgi:hypothetical protein
VITRDIPSSVYLASCSAINSSHIPVLIDITCRSFLQHPPGRPDFRGIDWVKFPTHLEPDIPLKPVLHTVMAIDTCIENFSEAVLSALSASTPKCRQCDDPRPSIPAGIQD